MKTHIERLAISDHLILHLLGQLLEEPFPRRISPATDRSTHAAHSYSLEIEIPMGNDRAPARRHLGLCRSDTLDARLERLGGAFGGLGEPVDARAEGGDGV